MQRSTWVQNTFMQQLKRNLIGTLHYKTFYHALPWYSCVQYMPPPLKCLQLDNPKSYILSSGFCQRVNDHFKRCLLWCYLIIQGKLSHDRSKKNLEVLYKGSQRTEMLRAFNGILQYKWYLGTIIHAVHFTISNCESSQQKILVFRSGTHEHALHAINLSSGLWNI